jgi:superfamily II DNA or RNA helicase
MGMYVQAAVDSHLWVDTRFLKPEVVGNIEQALMIDNMAKQEALDRHVAGAADMEDYIELFEWEGDWLVTPRGFASQLVEGMDSLGIEVRWRDERNRSPGHKFVLGNKIPARDYQEKIIAAILDAEQGIVKAPTGSGKTVAALELFRQLRGNALVIVGTKEIAQQWLDRIAGWLGEGYPCSLIGDNEFEISPGITVAIQASLWSKRKELEEGGFFKRFRAVCLDECHHATANTYRYIVDRFTAAVRFGMSATPEKTGDFRLVETVLGPIIVEITDAEVETQIMKPEIHVIETEFGAVFIGDKMTDHGFRRNNYETILKKLSEDNQRNRLIVREIIENHADAANLILSKRIAHLSNLWEMLVAEGYDENDILTLYGGDTRADRKASIERTEEGHCVILSTLADEALDAPRLDRLHLVWPTANPELLIQQIGRIRRRHPGKTEAIVIDYRDFQVRPFEKQYMTRRHEVYDPNGFRVLKRRRPT